MLNTRREALRRAVIVREVSAKHPNATAQELVGIINRPDITIRVVNNALYKIRSGRLKQKVISTPEVTDTRTEPAALRQARTEPTARQVTASGVDRLIRDLRVVWEPGKRKIVVDGVVVTEQSIERLESYFKLLITQLNNTRKQCRSES